MKVSLNFLKDYISIDNISIEELKEKIYLQMIEIEAHKEFKNIENVVIGRVLEKNQHENADKLSVCKVDVGTEVLQIVCGAPNVDKNQLVIVAKENAVLPGNFKIKKSVLRGVESNGMICSLEELGFDNSLVSEKYRDGIYVLPEGAVIGKNPLEFLHLIDHQIELGLTPNRSDLLSYIGIAYDLKAILNREITLPDSSVIEEQDKNPITVEIASNQCLKYSCRVLKDAVIKESPEFIKARLMLSGIRPINNIVDITNYVLLEYGQPLHAFDLDLFNSNKIFVRNAYKDEKTITLDHQERTLNESELVITNGSDIECIAGVMGCLKSSVTSSTKNIILEAAYFAPECIRKTSKRLNLKSESSVRFERKIDITRVDEALNRACHLLQKYADCKVLKEIKSAVKDVQAEKKCQLTLAKTNLYLGTEIQKNEFEDILHRLGIGFKEINQEDYQMILPNRRVDLENYQDVLEEIARIYSYNKIPLKLPSFNTYGGLTYKQHVLRFLEDNLSHLGLNQAITYSLINEKDMYEYTLNHTDEYYKLLMPLSEDRKCYRLSLLNNLIEAAKYNMDRNFDHLSLFEIGKTYTKTQEKTNLAMVCVNTYNSLSFKHQENKYDYYAVKGILDSVLQKFDVQLEYRKYHLENPNYHPYKSAILYYRDQIVGVLGSLHPKYLQKYNLEDIVVLEINIDFLFEVQKQNIFETINKFPRIERDLALICDHSVEASEVVHVIRQSAKNVLTHYEIFDLYIGENIQENKKSLGIKLTFENKEKTLSCEEVDQVVQKILKNLKEKLSIALR